MMMTLTVLGLSSMRSWSMFMPGMRTVIFRGPLKPSTFVSCTTKEQCISE